MNDENIDSTDLEIHISQKHFTCDICQKEFFTQIQFLIHSIIHLLPERFNCHECQDGFAHIVNLDKHLEMHNIPIYIVCHACKKEFFDIDSLNEHAKKHSSDSINASIVQQVRDNEKSPIKIQNNGTQGSCQKDSNVKPMLKRNSPGDKLLNFFRCDRCKNKFPEKHFLDEHHHQSQCAQKEFDSNEDEELEPVIAGSVDSCDVPNHDEPLVSENFTATENVMSLENSQIGESEETFTDISQEWLDKDSNMCSQNSPSHSSMDHSDEKNFACCYCEKTFPFKNLLNYHLQNHEVKELSCSVCQKRFATKDELFNHIYIHAIVKTFTCKVCQMIFSEKSLLAKHRLSHTSKPKVPFICDMCQETFLSRRSLDSHHKRVHLGLCPYLCDVCSKGFKVQRDLRRHKFIHTGEKPFQCEYCGSSFNQKSTLNKHLLTHQPKETTMKSGIGKKTCSVCPESSGNSQLCIHSMEKSFKCETCEKSFASKEYLRQHEFIHIEHAPFVCEICNKGFRRKHRLKVHQRSHAGEKPFLCEACGIAYTTKAGLQAHSYTHIEAPFRCKVCQKGFALKANFERHVRMHTGERPFVCDMCGGRFTQKNHLTYHLRTIHAQQNEYL